MTTPHTESTAIDGLYVITSRQVPDERGVVREFFRQSSLSGLPVQLGPWVQLNVTQSSQGVIRGMHGENITKLVGIVAGEAFGAYVDIRPISRTRGVIVSLPLIQGLQVLVPRGVCNGFQSISPGITQYLYCFDAEWVPDRPGYSIHPLDPDLAIPWPIPVYGSDTKLLSRKDAAAPKLREVLDQTAL